MEHDLVVDIERRGLHRTRRRPRRSPQQLARGLGWWSLGLGIAQVLAPRTMARLTGMRLPPTLTMLCGARAIACGVGILTQDQAQPWMRVRVAGDALDLATVAAGLLLPGANRQRLAVTGVALGGVAAADVYCSRQLEHYGARAAPRHVTSSIDVQRPREEIYRFWRDPANFPRVMPHLHSVQILDDIHSHWIANGPGGTRLEWDTEIIDDVPNERLAWRSVDGSQIYSAGSVELHPVGMHATRVRLELLCDSPPGSLTVAIAKLFGRDPKFGLRADLRGFKTFFESGETTGIGGA